MSTDICAINCREIEPLLAKARQVLLHYDRAMDLSTAILDLSGHIVRPVDYERQLKFCEHCKKSFHSSTQSWQGRTYPCDKLHLDALAGSRKTGKGHVYSCNVGFAYWTSPIYRNGSYAGALTAGQPLLCERREALEKFSLLCDDRTAAQKFKTMLESVSEKNSDEIRAMANLLEACANEISEKADDMHTAIRRIARQDGEAKSIKVTVPENQIEKERVLLAAFQRGDSETGCKIIYELVDGISSGGLYNLEMKRIRALELLVILSRATANPGPSLNSSIQKANNKNFKRIQESRTNEELKENLQLAAEQMAAEIFSFKGMRHASALRKAQRYIWKNLAKKVNLEEVSKVAGLSAPYFSTIFKDEMGENFSCYINRLRVEKAATLLTETRSPIKTIAKNCGFEDQSWFSKIFKKITGVTPGKYRETGSLAGNSYGP